MLEKQSFCKVNLLLNILGKRPDGFHALETVMHPVALHDDLTFKRGGRHVWLECDDPSLPVDGRNLISRAASAFLSQARIGEGVRIRLRKRLPIAAGLGGGSGNAAVTLLALNELFDCPLENDVLMRLAASLGSDVPFFLQSRPALATGRGEVIEPLEPFAALRGAHIALVHPGFGISTPWAYSQLARHPEALNGQAGRARKFIEILQTGSLAAAGGALYNSLEAPALQKYPLLAMFREFFLGHGASGALMSGSGSSVFALFSSGPAAEDALSAFEAKFGPSIWKQALPFAM